MPELPEVETVVCGLREKVLGRVIVDIEEFRVGTVYGDYSNEEFDFPIISINRRGKYILIRLENETKLVIHLRMTGKLILRKEDKKIERHDRARLLLDNGKYLVFNDIRTFGKIEIFNKSDNFDVFDKLGPEPLGKKFDEKYLKGIIINRNVPVKNLLLDQSVIAGLGNIYVSEILHRAGISPLRSGNSMKNIDIVRIVEETKKVLSEAIALGGTTISDYRDANDKKGKYQTKLQVYGKNRCKCGRPIIKIKQAGRSSFYCSYCQK